MILSAQTQRPLRVRGEFSGKKNSPRRRRDRRGAAEVFNYSRTRSERLLSAFASTQHSAREENDSQENVDDVIHFAEHEQCADIEHMLRPRAQKPTAHSQQQVHQTEDYAESPRRACRSRKPEIKSEGARHDVHQIMCRVEMRTQQSRRGEARDAHDQDRKSTRLNSSHANISYAV